MNNPAYLDRALKRERAARTQAELLLEKQTRDLYLTNEALQKQNVIIEQHSKKLELFLSIIQMSHEVLAFEEQLKYFIKSVCEMSDWPVGHIYLPSASDSDELHSSPIWYFYDEIYAEFKEMTEKTILKKGIGLPGRVVETRKPIWIRDVTIDPNFPRFSAAAKDKLQSAFAIPIIVGEKIVAISEFFFNKMADKDFHLLQTVEAAGQQLALAIEKEQQKLEHQKKLDNINKQLIIAARQAGMAEVAISVLHNIGNIMNSVNVAALSLSEKLKATNFDSLINIEKLIREHQKDFDNFINNDPQGKSLLSYINKIPTFWEERKKIFIEGVTEVNKNIKNINEIIVMQQSLAGATGTIENILLPDIIEEALKLNKSTFPHSGVNIVKKYAIQPFILTDKVKILQILVNLIRNAYETIQADAQDKSITIQISAQNNNEEICIEVIDQGKGISPENLTKIFSYGFTTKKKGHGIGLHASALAAKELGGSLIAESPGENQGAIFKLVLPIKPKQKKIDQF